MLSIFEGIMSQSTSTNNQSKLNSTEIVGLIDEQLNLMQQQLDIVKNDVDNQDNLNKLMSICGGVIDNMNVDNVDTDEVEEFVDYEWDLVGYHADKPVQPDFGQPSPNAPKGSFNFGKASSSSSSSSCSSSFSFGAPKKCKATTAKGLPCARGAKVEGLCTQHFKLGQSNIHVHVCNKDDNKSHNMAKTKLKIQDDKVLQCAATTKKGKRCSNKARFSGFCGLHKKNSDDVIDHLDNIMNQMNL